MEDATEQLDTSPDDLTAEEKEQLRQLRIKATRLENQLKKLKTVTRTKDSVQRENDLRKARGQARHAEMAMEMQVERLPYTDRVWYDGLPAKVFKPLPGRGRLLVKVWSENGRVITHEGILELPYRNTITFVPNDDLYVERNPNNPDRFQLVAGSEYNFRGVRIK